VDDTALTQALPEVQLDGGEQPGGAVADHQQRRGESPVLQIAEDAIPGVGGLGGRRRQADEDRLAFGVDARGGQHGLGR